MNPFKVFNLSLLTALLLVCGLISMPHSAKADETGSVMTGGTAIATTDATTDDTIVLSDTESGDITVVDTVTDESGTPTVGTLSTSDPNGDGTLDENDPNLLNGQSGSTDSGGDSGTSTTDPNSDTTLNTGTTGTDDIPQTVVIDGVTYTIDSEPIVLIRYTDTTSSSENTLDPEIPIVEVQQSDPALETAMYLGYTVQENNIYDIYLTTDDGGEGVYLFVLRGPVVSE